jgi:hypothetical protein
MLSLKQIENLNEWDYIEATNYTCQECKLEYGPADRMLTLQIIRGNPIVMCFLCIDGYNIDGTSKGLPHGWRFMQ